MRGISVTAVVIYFPVILKVFSGMGEDNILVIRWSLDSLEGVNSCCNTCIFKILTSFPSPVLFNYIVHLG